MEYDIRKLTGYEMQYDIQFSTKCIQSSALLFIDMHTAPWKRHHGYFLGCNDMALCKKLPFTIAKYTNL